MSSHRRRYSKRELLGSLHVGYIMSVSDLGLVPGTNRWDAAAALWIQVLADIASESFEVLPILDVHYQLAETLIGRHAFRNPMRTLDALQLAVALSRSEQAVLDGFVVADQALSKIALAEKLAVVLVA